MNIYIMVNGWLVGESDPPPRTLISRLLCLGGGGILVSHAAVFPGQHFKLPQRKCDISTIPLRKVGGSRDRLWQFRRSDKSHSVWDCRIICYSYSHSCLCHVHPWGQWEEIRLGRRWMRPAPVGPSVMFMKLQNRETGVQDPQDPKPEGPNRATQHQHFLLDPEPEPQVPAAHKTFRSPISASHQRQDASQQQTQQKRSTRSASQLLGV